MCGRYRFKDPKLIAEAIKAVLGGDLTMAEFLQRWNVAPSQFLPVAHAHEGSPQVVPMRWGLVPFWDKTEKPKIAPINASRALPGTLVSWLRPMLLSTTFSISTCLARMFS